MYNGREDRIPVPKVQEGGKWEWVPTDKVVVIKDSAPAAANAMGKVWEDYEIHVATCCTHADIRWCSNNSGKFKDRQKSKVVSADIQHCYKLLGHINFLPVAQRLMRKKWMEQLGETSVARDWFNQWGQEKITRVENCQEDICPLRGGIPCDNNAVEAGNHVDKKALDYRKASLFRFVGDADKDIVREASLHDTRFESRMKNHSKHKNRLNKSVYNIKYFRHILEIEESHKNGEPTFLHLQLPFSDSANDVPRGSSIIAGEHCVKEVADLGLEDEASNKESCCRFLGGTTISLDSVRLCTSRVAVEEVHPVGRVSSEFSSG